MSIFVFVEKTDSQPQIPDKLANGLEVIYRIADDVERVQDKCSVQYDEFKEKYKPGLVEVVYEWAGGMVGIFAKACSIDPFANPSNSRSTRLPT